MGTWDRLLAVLRRESRDVGEAVADLTAKADAALDRRERELRASPSERMEIEQERAAENDAELEAIRRRIEGGGASS